MTEKKVTIKRGPVPDVKKDREVLKYRNDGKSYRWIAKETGQDVKNVYLRHKRALSSYTQV